VHLSDLENRDNIEQSMGMLIPAFY
jgi:hypothetical protein